MFLPPAQYTCASERLFIFQSLLVVKACPILKGVLVVTACRVARGVHAIVLLRRIYGWAGPAPYHREGGDHVFGVMGVLY